MTSKSKTYLYPSYERLYLARYREKVGLSIEELSFELGITRNYYYFIESGRRGAHLYIGLVAQLIKCLKIDAQEFIDEEVRYQKERALFIERYKKKLVTQAKR